MNISSSIRHYLPEIAIIFLALLIRLILINSSFWLDEAAQALESTRPFSEQFEIASDFQPPLMHLIVHGLAQLSTLEWWLRLAALIPGLLTIWFTMRLGEKWFSKSAGQFAGLLLATSQFHLFYSQELRPYSLAACFGVMTVWYWVKLMESKKRVSIGLFLASLGGLYSMYVFPTLLLTLFIITAIKYKQKLLLLTSYFLLLFVSFLPWLPSFMEQVSIGTSFAADKPVWASMVSPPLYKMLPLVYAKFALGRIPLELTASIIITALIYMYLAFPLFLKSTQSEKGRLSLLLAILPVLLAFAISIRVPVLDPKRVLFALPFFYLSLVSGYRQSWKIIAALIILISLNLTAVRLYAINPELQREPWRQAVADIEAESTPTDIVVFPFSGPYAPWRWYQTKNLQTVSITTPNDPATKEALVNTSDSASQIFTFIYLTEIYDPNREIDSTLQNAGRIETGFFQYENIGKIKIYQ
jgi:uncharacterized membrane protein